MRARLQRLRAEIRSDRQAFEAHLDELASLNLSSPGPGDLARAAVALHHAYGAIEGALARIAQVLEEGVPEGPDWHRALLHAMGLEVEGVRPAVLSPASVASLQHLLAFRHFFRHAYAVALDARRLEALQDDSNALRPVIASDLDRIDAWLEGLADAAD